MATKNLISGSDQQEEDPTLKQSDEETDSESESEEEVAPPLVPHKKPKFITPLKPLGPETVENGSACSSPSASGFIIMPSQKPSAGKKKKKKASALKVFGDDDVIALLKGLAAFWVNGKNNKWAEFHDFIKGDLRNQFTKTQVSEKIRTLKKKFYANSERARANGGHLDLSDAHESAVFELSKELWGDETGIAPEKGQKAENEDEEADDTVRERKVVSENDEGSKNVKKRKHENDEGSKSTKKRKQVAEHGEVNKKIRKREHGIKELLEEGDEHDAANTILSIKNMVDDHGGGNKKTRKGEQVDELDDKEELLKEDDEATKIPSKQKLVDECGEGKRKTKKRKQLDERDEANKTAREQKEEDEHDENEELMNEENRADEYEEQDVTTGKKKQVDGHEVKKYLAKQVDGHHEEDNIPVNQKQEMKISAEDFQSAYPLLSASFDIFGYPMVAKENFLMIGRENAQELEEKWREFNAEAHHLELKRLELMKKDSQGRLQRK